MNWKNRHKLATPLLIGFAIFFGIAGISTQAHATFGACAPVAATVAGGTLWRLTATNPGVGFADSVCAVIAGAGGSLNNGQIEAGFNPCFVGGGVGGAGVNQVWVDWEARGDCVRPGGVVQILFQCALGNCVPPALSIVSVTWHHSNGTDAGFVPGTIQSLTFVGGIGGEIVPVDKLALVAPYIGLASLVGAVALATVFHSRRAKNRKNGN